ncbi:GNAT family N-acetyltransferase [Actinomyces sp. zg-332]|nr:GNAT family N-acetyltransferase [Actinomyces sp. zg-332]
MISQSKESDNDYIHKQLRKYNRQYMSNFKNYSFHIKQDPTDENSKIIAGIVASSTFDTLEVEFLFVDPDYRAKKYGKTLLQHVEQLAKQDNLKRILLNTYSFQAPDFYKKLGYTELFKISPCFSDFDQHFFVKNIEQV